MSQSASARPGPPVTPLTSLSQIAEEYRGVLSDIWGVVHNGVAHFPQACEALTKMRERGAAVVLITNAPRPREAVQGQLDRLGVPRGAYDAIVTSGDLTRERLRAHAGEGIYHLGPERDRVIFKDLNVRLVGPDIATLVINSGLFDDEIETPDDYRTLLADLAARNVEMICANPDIIVERGTRLVWCAGALAEIYEALGGAVVWAGKPHAPIYERALALIDDAAGGEVPRDRILAIGDSLRTDLAGAAAMGLDALFITEGIHAQRAGRGGPLDPAVVQEMLDEAGARPRAVMSRLVW